MHRVDEMTVPDESYISDTSEGDQNGACCGMPADDFIDQHDVPGIGQTAQCSELRWSDAQSSALLPA